MHEHLALQIILREEDHTHANIARATQGVCIGLRLHQALFNNNAVQKACGNLQDNAYAIARLAAGIFASAVFQLFYNAQGVFHASVAADAFYLNNAANAA